MLRRLANQLVRGQGKYLSHEDLIGAFTERSKRLVTHEPLLQFMQTVKTPDEKLERLLTVEENIIGAENKRTLSTFMMPIITSNSFEDQLMGRRGAGAALEARHRASAPRVALGLSGCAEEPDRRRARSGGAAHRRARAVPGLAGGEIRQSGRACANAVKTLRRADLHARGVGLAGRRMLLASLAKPGFLSAYLAAYPAQPGQERPAPADQEKALGELVGQLGQVGITPEEGLRPGGIVSVQCASPQFLPARASTTSGTRKETAGSVAFSITSFANLQTLSASPSASITTPSCTCKRSFAL